MRFLRRAISKRLIPLLLGFLCITLLFSCQGLFDGSPSENTSSNPSSSTPLAPPQTPTVEQPVAPSDANPPISVSRDRLQSHLIAISKERYSDRQRQETRRYIESVLTQNGWTIEEQDFAEGMNIIAHRPDQSLDQPEILVGAHYDSVRGTPGADDNATGVAATLELSHVFQAYKSQKRLTLAFFDQEESGGLGSTDYVNRAENLAQLDGAVILEMLGYTCFTPYCQGIPPELDVKPPSDQGDFLSVIGDTEHPFLIDTFRAVSSPLELFSLDVPFKGLFAPILLRSDHAPFWLKGKGAVMVSDTAFLRNPHYHRASDTPDTLDLDFMAQSTEFVSQATAVLLNSSMGN